MIIIGREYEQNRLEKAFQSEEAEFIAVYGRRRIGKTYLIREFFENKDCIFLHASGIHKGKMSKQLEQFKKEIESTFYTAHKGINLANFSDWGKAFEALTDAIKLTVRDDKKKIVIFLDEVPWMAGPKSNFLVMLDYYWNRHWSIDSKIKLIVCGSAASWMIEKILHDKGGLHNRVTLRLPVEPFTLAECKSYLHYRNINYSNKQILTLYMCLGGIPFYLKFVEKGLSAIQNINRICFHRKGTLYDEFDLLFSSLFQEHEMHEELIRFIGSKREGVSRSEIEHKLAYKGGSLTKRLRELEAAGFIISFIPWKKERGIFYKVIDEYTLFYLTWIACKNSSRISKNIDDDYWEILSQTSSWKAWSGYAFEAICFKHVSQIKKALQIPDGSEVSSWKYLPKKNEKKDGAQIDLVFDRPDNVVNLCEIKYCNTPFKLDKKHAKHFMKQEDIYREVTKTDKQIFCSLISSSGVKNSIYESGIIQSTVTLDDLFRG